MSGRRLVNSFLSGNDIVRRIMGLVPSYLFDVVLQWGRQKIEKHDRRRSTENALKNSQLSNGDACEYCLAIITRSEHDILFK